MADSSGVDIRITLNAEARVSDIRIRPGLLQEAGRICKTGLPRLQRCLVVTDHHVSNLYADALLQSLKAEGIDTALYGVPAGESSKSMAEAQRIYDAAIAHKLSRTDGMIALGGGVIGDLTGFCAATYYRGLSLVQIPTTLVAQVDSSIGGKTALNTGQVKNAIGTFYQPHMVLVDPNTLNTLPPREIQAGLAEVVKYALIEESCTGRTGFLEFLEAHSRELTSYYKVIIHRCCEIKAKVVMEDELDLKGIRAFLNLGHTFGHAYETLTGYERFLHGEAVALGTLKAFELSASLKLIDANLHRRVRSLFERMQLAPAQDWETVNALSPRQILDVMKQDKKAEQGQLKLVLPVESAGRVTLTAVPDEAVLAVLP